MKNEPNTSGPAANGEPDQSGEHASAEYETKPGSTADQKIAELEAQLAEANSRALRVMADFQNYQRRALANEREAREQATKSVAQSVLPVLDHADLALNQDPTKVTAEAMFRGFEALRAELLKVLGAYGIVRIEPVRDDPFDPTRHSAVTRQNASGVRPGHIVATLQAGYSLGDRIVRPAMVAVAPADETDAPS